MPSGIATANPEEPIRRGATMTECSHVLCDDGSNHCPGRKNWPAGAARWPALDRLATDLDASDLANGQRAVEIGEKSVESDTKSAGVEFPFQCAAIVS